MTASPPSRACCSDPTVPLRQSVPEPPAAVGARTPSPALAAPAQHGGVAPATTDELLTARGGRGRHSPGPVAAKPRACGSHRGAGATLRLPRASLARGQP